MSRIGKRKILIPDNVQVETAPEYVLIKSGSDKKRIEIDPRIKAELKEGALCLSALKRTKDTRRVHGLTRALCKNAIHGLGKGYKLQLEFLGVGFRVALSGSDLTLNLGYSHEIKIAVPKDIDVKIEKNLITLTGKDVGEVTNFASRIKRLKPVEPYKGKGIKLKDEFVRRKVGKTVEKEERE